MGYTAYGYRRPLDWQHLARWFARGLAVLGVLAASTAQAETMYVIDQLKLGVHEDKSADSAILKLIPTGAAVEIMGSDDTYAQVRTEDGVVGWVDARYLMAETPAQTELAELRTRYDETHSQLEQAQLQVEDLNAQLEDLAKAQTAPAEEGVLEQDNAGEIARLTEENTLLKEELLNLERSAFAEVVLTPPPLEQRPPQQEAKQDLPAAKPQPRAPDQSVFGLSKYQWIFMGALAVLCFGLGAYLVDYSARKRHGGFRL